MVEILDKLQDVLGFRHCTNPVFSNELGVGRTAVIATLLGFILGLHLTLLVGLAVYSSDNESSLSGILLFQWCIHVCVIVIFHLLEFFVTAYCNSTVVSATSFVVDQSKSYTTAMIVSSLEFWLKFGFLQVFGELVVILPLSLRWVGLFLVFTGQAIRSIAMITCGSSFNHLIQRKKKEDHVLVTHGIYSIFRHPSYVGWFYWSIGTQLVCLNPFSTIAYAFASWYFFKQRIPYEEKTLTSHFGEEYTEYIEKTWLGIPFIPHGSNVKHS